MDSDEVDIKPTVSVSDIPDKNSFTTAAGGKLKRYEDVWPEDVHAAFMEAATLYPPMGKRRLKYYRVTPESNHFPDANQAKSFGRCQLIQSYILEKTGKNRSRKQVSSHLQRLKKIHKDNPTLRLLFSSERTPPEHYSKPQMAISAQDIFTNISVSTRHLKSEFDFTLNVQNTDNKSDSSSLSTCTSQAASSLNGNTKSCETFDLSTNFYNQPSAFSSPEYPPRQQYPTGALYSSDGDYLSALQGPVLSADAVDENRSISALNTSAFSVSMRRFTSRLPLHGRHVDCGPITHFSRLTHSPAFQPADQQWAHDGMIDGLCCNSPLTQAQPAFHIPFHYPQLIPEKQRFDPGLACDWMLPQTPDRDISFGPRDSNFGELHIRYPGTTNQYNPTNPMKANSPWSYTSPSESEVSRLPRGTSYSHTVETPPGLTLGSDGSKEDSDDFTRQAVSESSEYLAPPPVIRPTPIYPNSYIHSDVFADKHTPTPNPIQNID